MSKEPKPDLPEILMPARSVSLHRSSDNNGYVLKIICELEFQGQEPRWVQQGFYLTDYELGPFLETVDEIRNAD